MSTLSFSHRPSRSSHRARFSFPCPAASSDDPRLSDYPKKARQTPPPQPRHVPLSALISTVALAFFVLGLVFSRRLGNCIVDNTAPPIPNPLPRDTLVRDLPVRGLAHKGHVLDTSTTDITHQTDTTAHRIVDKVDDPDGLLRPPNLSGASTRDSKDDNHPDTALGMGVEDPKEPPPHIKLPPSEPVKAVNLVNKVPEPPIKDDLKPVPERKPVSPDGRVSWDRSWPLSAAHDDGGLYRLSRNLNFSNETLFNYFHMHKTGGVSTKVELMYLLRREENSAKISKRGKHMRCIETCYQLDQTPNGDKSIEHMWRCDFGRILNMTQDERDKIDVMMGHQYWENGCDAIFGRSRQVKHFSIFRHPLPRKLSFFYHFFVRNLGRDEKTIDKDEVIGFLLGDRLPNDPRTRDAGPNYYASRLLSDGIIGFAMNHRYEIPREQEDAAIAQVLDRLNHRFAFVGLQLQPEASQCMLQKAMQVLAHEHGIDDLVGTPKLAESTRRLNTGGYPWTASKIWGVMDEQQKSAYRQVEKVDLAIYDRVVRRFKEDVEMFSCTDKVKQEEFSEDVFE